MTHVRLTPKFIKDALKKELAILQPGQWFDVQNNVYTARVGDVCQVCAVGAVMRHAIASNQTADYIQDAAVSACRGAPSTPIYGRFPRTIGQARGCAKRMAQRGQYMASLSYLFESMGLVRSPNGETWFRTSTRKQVLDQLYDLIDTFPPSIVVDIDGAKPARDVKVVRTPLD